MRGCGQHPASPSARFNRSLKIRYQSGVILENQDCVLPAFQNPLHGNDMLQRAGADRSLALYQAPLGDTPFERKYAAVETLRQPVSAIDYHPSPLIHIQSSSRRILSAPALESSQGYLALRFDDVFLKARSE
jgi:hypothetical protein